MFLNIYLDFINLLQNQRIIILFISTNQLLFNCSLGIINGIHSAPSIQQSNLSFNWVKWNWLRDGAAVGLIESWGMEWSCLPSLNCPLHWNSLNFILRGKGLYVFGPVDQQFALLPFLFDWLINKDNLIYSFLTIQLKDKRELINWWVKEIEWMCWWGWQPLTNNPQCRAQRSMKGPATKTIQSIHSSTSFHLLIHSFLFGFQLLQLQPPNAPPIN